MSRDVKRGGGGGGGGAAIGGKTARACDSCLHRRARWYCGADDAFLCQSCDVSVHSANPLARRHERLRLRVSASLPAKRPSLFCSSEEFVPAAWFKRKARTPRGQGQIKSRGGGGAVLRQLVPDMAECSDENKEEEDGEEQLLYSVPIFDPGFAEFRSPSQEEFKLTDIEVPKVAATATTYLSSLSSPQIVTVATPSTDDIAAREPSEAELTEFAADMEALLCVGQDSDESFNYMQSLGFLGHDAGVKVELDVVGSTDVSAIPDVDMESGGSSSMPLHLNAKEEEEDDHYTAAAEAINKFRLKLDYEAIMASWGTSPWTDGERPDDVKPDLFVPDYYACNSWTGTAVSAGTMLAGGWPDTEGREARVTRYREKRRTRLFSKKIRYEVRKLNAEKRPRLKGRFVKRASPLGAAQPGR